MTAAAAVTVGMATPANAIPNPLGADDDLFSIHLVVPDPANALALCSITYTPTSRVIFTSTGLAVGTAHESGRMSVKSSGCSSVTWTTVIIVSDQSPTHAPRTVVATGSTTATASQNVPYAIGVREAGVVTVTMLASSRLGNFCWEDRYQVTALGNPTPVDSNPC
ncbi:MAG TPA: hypothetical protein VNA20_01835 [Frankiaceae bacterium]|nr:hypothetical protein [Frankiaceae bacterium]